MKKYLFLTPLLLLPFLGISCKSVSAGSDPFVVRVEQAENTAKASFDFVLRLDQSDRGFWRTNAPAFHNYCEWLRAKTPLVVDGVQTNAPRAIAMLYTLDDLKLAYQQGKAQSNAVYTALLVLQTSLSQANAWMNIVTNR